MRIENQKVESVMLNYVLENEIFKTKSTHIPQIKSDTTIRIRVINQLIFEVFGNAPAKGIVFPGDTVIIYVNYKGNAKNTFQFKGNSAPMCQYYTSQIGNYPYLFLNAAKDKSDPVLSEFNKIDETYNWIEQYVEKYNDSVVFPKKFVSFEKLRIKYDKYSQMLKYIHSFNESNTNKIYANPEYLLWFSGVSIDNPEAIGIGSYYEFLWQYFLWKEKIYWVKFKPVDIRWLGMILPNVKTEIKEKTQEWFLTNTLVNFYSAIDFAEVDTAYEQIRLFIKDENNINLILEARDKAINRKKLRFANTAKLGSRAPSFFLKDTLKAVYSLSNFKDKWVLISFYNSSVADKLDSLLDTNVRLIGSGSQNIKFLNIYIDQESVFWKKFISSSKNSGIHLFAKGNWSKILIDSYGLEALPNYFLVDRNGNIYSKARDNKEFESLMMEIQNKI